MFTTKQKRIYEMESQADALFVEMNKLPLDSEEYRKLHEEYAKYIDEIAKLKNGGKLFERIVTVIGLIISIGGTFYMPKWLALKATNDEEEMKLPNHRVTNLIGKKFDK